MSGLQLRGLGRVEQFVVEQSRRAAAVEPPTSRRARRRARAGTAARPCRRPRGRGALKLQLLCRSSPAGRRRIRRGTVVSSEPQQLAAAAAARGQACARSRPVAARARPRPRRATRSVVRRVVDDRRVLFGRPEVAAAAAAVRRLRRRAALALAVVDVDVGLYLQPAQEARGEARRARLGEQVADGEPVRGRGSRRRRARAAPAGSAAGARASRMMTSSGEDCRRAGSRSRPGLRRRAV